MDTLKVRWTYQDTNGPAAWATAMVDTVYGYADCQTIADVIGVAMHRVSITAVCEDGLYVHVRPSDV